MRIFCGCCACVSECVCACACADNMHTVLEKKVSEGREKSARACVVALCCDITERCWGGRLWHIPVTVSRLSFTCCTFSDFKDLRCARRRRRHLLALPNRFVTLVTFLLLPALKNHGLNPVRSAAPLPLCSALSFRSLISFVELSKGGPTPRRFGLKKKIKRRSDHPSENR